MRDFVEPAKSSAAERRSDLRLWTGMLLGPLAMGLNTIAGFTVAHWTSDTNQKKLSCLVSGFDFFLCICAFAISYSLYRAYRGADEAVPVDGRRSFMAKIGLLLSAVSMLVVIAGTLAVLIIHPAD